MERRPRFERSARTVKPWLVVLIIILLHRSLPHSAEGAFTVDDGWVWIFAAVEHWNAECVGWHAGKVGSRFAALEPIAQGLQRIYGSVDADVARGLALRMDHGNQYLSDHFLNQIRYWGVRPSFGFVEEPETNGVVERWNRTLKEQAIHGRIFQTLEAVRGGPR